MVGKQIRVLVLLYDGVNTLDVNGPLEVLCNFALRGNSDDPNWCPFKIDIASKEVKLIKTYEFIHLLSYTTFQEALTNIKNKAYDVLITPGYASRAVMEDLKTKKDPIFDVIRAFFATDSQDKERWIISICTGALLHAYAGVFDGQTATTHWGAVQDKQIEYYSDNKAKSERRRWLEGEKTRGIRILSSGGISCGIDAMLYFISQQKGLKQKGLLSAQKVAHMMDYTWNGGPPQPEELETTGQQWSEPSETV